MAPGTAAASVTRVRTIIIAGAGGRDFHDFNVLYRDDPDVRVVAFTAAQIPGIDDRVYPAALAGPQYPDGIPVRPERELPRLIAEHEVDEVVFAYSDLPHEEVMHRASIVLAAGAGFTFSAPRRTMLRSTKPVVAVCATRTGAGKSQTTRRVGALLQAAGPARRARPPSDALPRPRAHRGAAVRRRSPTSTRRTRRSRSARSTSGRSPQGMVMYAGVDYGAILEAAQAEADVVIWDGGNNDLPFFAPDLLIVVADPLRAGDELRFHPGEASLRMADVVLVNKVDSASEEQVATVLANVAAVNPGAGGAARRLAGDARRRARRSPVSRCSSSRTARRSRTAGCRSARGRSPRARRAPCRSTRGRTPPARSPRCSSASRTSARCCPRWATRPRSSRTSRRRSPRRRARP